MDTRVSWYVRITAVSLSLVTVLPLSALANETTTSELSTSQSNVDSIIQKLKDESDQQAAQPSPQASVDAIIDKLKAEGQAGETNSAPVLLASASPSANAAPEIADATNPIKMHESLDMQSSPGGPQSVDDLTREILLDEIKLEKFNLNYRLEAAKQGRWKGWRYFTLQETNSSLTMAGLIMGVAERGEHLKGNEFKKNSNTILENGNYLGAIGQIIGASGSGLELSINTYHSWQAARHGFSPKDAKEYVVSVVDDLNKKIQQRDALLAAGQGTPDADCAQMARLESTVLTDFRDLSVTEFDRFHVGARKTLAQQNSFYLLDITKNVSGAVGNFLAEHAISSKDRHYNDSAGICMTVSGALIVANPLLSRAIGKVAEKCDKKQLEAAGLASHPEDASKLKADYQQLHAFCDSHKSMNASVVAHSLGRLDAYDCNEQYFADQIHKNSNDLRKGNRIAVQNIGSGFLVGGTKIAAGALLTDAGVDFVGNAQKTNRLIFAGNTTYLCGTAYAVIDNARIQVQREITYQKLKRHKELPGQLIHARIDKLATIEKNLM